MTTKGNPQNSPVTDLLTLAILAGLGYVGYKLLSEKSSHVAQPTTAHGASGAILWDMGSQRLQGARDGEIIFDKYGNAFQLLSGGQQIRDVNSGIVYSAAILQTKYDLEG